VQSAIFGAAPVEPSSASGVTFVRCHVALSKMAENRESGFKWP